MDSLRNLRDLVHMARLRLDDTPGDSVGIDWENEDTGLKWTNWELTQFFNQAQEEVAARVPIADSETAACCTIDLSVAGGATYATHGQILFIKRIIIDGESGDLLKVTREYLDEHQPSWEQSDAGTPTHYFDDRDIDQITFWRPPDGDYTARLEVGRLPLTSMRWTHRAIDKPEIKDKYWLDLIDYVAHLAYLKRDSQTFDQDASTKALQVFNFKFGERPNRRVERERHEERNRPRRVRAHYF